VGSWSIPPAIWNLVEFFFFFISGHENALEAVFRLEDHVRARPHQTQNGPTHIQHAHNLFQHRLDGLEPVALACGSTEKLRGGVPETQTHKTLQNQMFHEGTLCTFPVVIWTATIANTSTYTHTIRKYRETDHIGALGPTAWRSP